MSTKRESSIRPSRRSPRLPAGAPPPNTPPAPPSPPSHVFDRDFLAWLAERDEPDTASEADTAGPWHIERDPQGGWAILRQGESFANNPDLFPTATFERKEAALLGAAVLPGTGRRRATASPASRMAAAIPSIRTAGSSATPSTSTRISSPP
jgi:hypothetical protein